MTSIDILTHAALMFADPGCPEIETLVDWVQDGQPENSVIAAHVATCRRCDAERVLAATAFDSRAEGRESLTASSAQVSGAAITRVAERVRASMEDRLRGTAGVLTFDRERPAKASSRSGRPRRMTWVLAAAAIVAAVGLAPFLLRERLVSPPALSGPEWNGVLRGASLEIDEVAIAGADLGSPAALDVRWGPIAGATEYRLRVERVDGTEVATVVAHEPNARLAGETLELARRVSLELTVAAVLADGSIVTGPLFLLDPAALSELGRSVGTGEPPGR